MKFDKTITFNKINKKIQKNKVINILELVKLGINRTEILRKIRADVYKHVGKKGLGYITLYEINDLDAELAIITKYYPQAVISGKTALTLYEFADEYIEKYDVDIVNTTNIKNSFLRVHRIDKKKIFFTEKRKFNNSEISVKIYSPERTLYEAYKYGSRSELYFKALKRYRKLYLNKKNPADQYEKFKKIDKKFKSNILRDLIMEDVVE